MNFLFATAVLNGKDNFCEVSIINERYILIAKHCVEDVVEKKLKKS